MRANRPTVAKRRRCVSPLECVVFLNGVLFLGVVLSVAGCSKRDGTPRGPTARAPTGGSPTKKSNRQVPDLGQAGTYTVVDVPNPGRLKVASIFVATAPDDSVPVQGEVPVTINVEACGHKVFTEDLIVDAETRALKNVVVRIEGITKGSRKPPETVEVTNKNCTFVPHVSVAMKGTRLQVRNDDPVQHTTHPYVNKIHFFNTVLSAGAEPSKPRTLRQVGLMEIECDVHSWMKGFTVIHTNPYIAVSDEKGQLAIDQIPPGEYTYVAWHETLPEQRGTVKIEPGKTQTLNLSFKLAQ